VLTEIKTISRNDIEAGLFVSINIENFEENYLWQMYVNVQNVSDAFRRDRTYNIETGIPIPPGTTLIQVQRELLQKLPAPFNDCVKQVPTIIKIFSLLN
jgi:hypothetical protein